MRSERAGFAKPLPSLQDQGPHNQKQSALDYPTGPLLQQVGAQMSPQNSVPCGFWRSRMCGYPHNELWLCLNNLPKCFKSKLLTSDARDSLYFLFLWFLGPVLSGAGAQRQGRKSQEDLGVGSMGYLGLKSNNRCYTQNQHQLWECPKNTESGRKSFLEGTMLF